MSARSRIAGVVLLSALVAAAMVTRPFLRGLFFVVRLTSPGGSIERLASLGTHQVSERAVEIEGAGGAATIRGRVYWPDAGPRRTMLLVTGLHPFGIDEPRLVMLARQLAASGIAVVTPDIPELSVFDITPAITDQVERAALWLAGNPSLRSGDGRIGLAGISFSGGLSLVAAGRPSLRGRLAYVLSIGGHDDLARVLRYLCTGVEPAPSRLLRLPAGRSSAGAAAGEPGGQGAVKRPHDYGVAIVLLGVADRLVPRAQVEPLRSALRGFLRASAIDSADKAAGQREFAAVREMAARLPQPSRTLMTYVNDRDVVHLGARLLPHVSAVGGHPSLSVSKSPKPSVPVFLLHGDEDTVIPSEESEFLADDLRGQAPVRLLLTSLITHAARAPAVRAGETIRLADFAGDLLNR